MTKTELERAVRAILMEQLGAPQVLSLDLPRVQVDESDRLDTGKSQRPGVDPRPADPVPEPPAGRGSDGHGEDHVPLASDLRRGGLYHRGTADGLQPVRFRHRRSRSGDLDPQGQPDSIFRAGICPVPVCHLPCRLEQSAVVTATADFLSRTPAYPYACPPPVK